MSKLDFLKAKAELARVAAGRAEQECLIAQRLEEIEKLEKSIEASDAKIKELEEKLKQLQGE